MLFRFWQILRVPEVEYISYNTGTHALPDIYALALGRCAPSGIVRIYQATQSCLCYNIYIYYMCVYTYTHIVIMVLLLVLLLLLT